jgi:hypothetical protein
MVQHGNLRQSRQASGAPQPALDQSLTSWRTPDQAQQTGVNIMAALPLIVFDVNETLLDLETMEPVFQRIFGDKSAMRLWFANPATHVPQDRADHVHGRTAGIRRTIGTGQGAVTRLIDGSDARHWVARKASIQARVRPWRSEPKWEVKRFAQFSTCI